MEVEANTSCNSLWKDVIVEKYGPSTRGLVDGGYSCLAYVCVKVVERHSFFRGVGREKLVLYGSGEKGG
jgi:hypothetical protein